MSDERGFYIWLLALGKFRNVSHHDDVFDWVNGSCALVLSATTIVFAVRTFVFQAIVHDVPEEMAKMTGVIVVFRLRVIDGVEAFLFRIPESPSKSALIVEQHLLLLREKLKVFLCAGLSGNIS